MPQPKWISSKKFPGVRWYLHPTRKNGIRWDRCFGIRYMVAGKRYEAVLGWESEGTTEEDAHIKRKQFIENAKHAKGPVTPRQEERADRRAVEKQAARSMSFEAYFEDRYLPDARTRKKPKTLRVERQHVRDWLAPVFKGKPMREIEPDALEAIKAAILKAGRTVRTAQHVLATFRLVWHHARKRNLAEAECPSRAVELGKIENNRTRFLSPKEIHDLLEEWSCPL